jgi:hypothetical protein
VTPAEFLIRVVDSVRHVLRGGRLEDDTFEAKARLPDFEATALQLGGHANAARGEPIIWILGLDEKRHRTVTVQDLDFADFTQRLEARFDGGQAPGLLYGRRIDAGTTSSEMVIAMAFDTSWAPYVVKRAEGGDWAFVVPWRYGTRTRAAARQTS